MNRHLARISSLLVEIQCVENETPKAPREDKMGLPSRLSALYGIVSLSGRV